MIFAPSTRIQSVPVSGPGTVLFVVFMLAGVAAAVLLRNPLPAFVGALLGFYCLFSVKVVNQWEKVALLRLGKYRGLRGPGMIWIIPVVDTLSAYVDQRIRVTDVSAESALTRDTVPVNVDAIVFWVVWNAEKSILEVANFAEAVSLGAQTALRECIGRHELAQLLTERETPARLCRRFWMRRRIRGASRCSRLKFAM